MINILILVLVLTALWVGYKKVNAKKVVGKRAEISPFRQNSNLSPLGTITVTLGKIKRKGDEVWFLCPLDNELSLGASKFDYIMLKAKKEDDSLNMKTAVVCYVMAGHSANQAPPEFIDWGLVRVV